MHHLRNYRDMVAKVDLLCGRITSEFAGQIDCHKGCDDCCRHLSLFHVEGLSIASALAEAEKEKAESIRSRARHATPDGPCPLLEEGACLLYEARPVICRTHGLPILTSQEGGAKVDFCPRNFRGVESLPGAAVVHIDTLNATLSAVNEVFVADLYGGAPPEKERMSVAEALLLDLG